MTYNLGRGGGYLVLSMPGCVCVCVENGRKGVLFQHEVNEMNKKSSFKMGVIFTSSICMDESCVDIL